MWAESAKTQQKRDVLCRIVIKIHCFGEFHLLLRFRFEGGVFLRPSSCLARGKSAEGAARGRLHCSRIGIRITAIRAQKRGAAPSPAEPRGHFPGTRSGAAPRCGVREQRCLGQAGRRHSAPTAPPAPRRLTRRGEQAENGLLPATRGLPAVSPPGSAQGRGSRRPRPGVTKWRLLFVCRRRRRRFHPPCRVPRPRLPPPPRPPR